MTDKAHLSLRSKTDQEEEVFLNTNLWFGVLFMYLFTVGIVLLACLGIGYLNRLELSSALNFCKRVLVDLILTIFTVGLLHSMTFTLLNGRTVRYSKAGRKVVFSANSIRYIFKRKYLICIFIFFFGVLVVETITNVDEIHPLVKVTKIFIGWVSWLAVFLFLLIFSRDNTEEEENDEEHDHKIVDARIEFQKYRKEVGFRTEYIKNLMKDINTSDRKDKAKKHFIKKMNEVQMKLIQGEI